MGIYAFIALLFSLSLLLIIFSVLCFKKKNSIYNCFGICSIFALISVICSIIYILSDNKQVMIVFSSLWLIGITFCDGYFLKIFYLYSKSKANKYYLIFLCVYLISDVILLFINCFTNIMFKLSFLEKNNILLADININPLFYFHVCFIILVSLSVVFLFINKINCVPRIYKPGYTISCLLIVICSILDLGFVFVKNIGFDITVFLIPLTLFSLYFSIFIHSPKALINKTKNLILDNVRHSVLAYDYEGNFIYANNEAIKLFEPSEIKYNFEDFRKKVLNNFALDTNRSFYFTKNIDSENLIFSVKLNEIYDDKLLVSKFISLRDITDELNMTKEKKYNFTHDLLTNTFNRDYFLEEAETRFNDFSDESFYIIASNFEKYRLINDMYGADYGDELLVDLADILRKYVKKYDFVFGRMGSDKFGIFISKSEFEKSDLLNKINNDFKSLNIPIVELKFGICLIKEERSIAKAYDRCILTLHHIKGNYTKLYEFYDDNYRDELLRENELIKEFDRSIRNHYFEIYYQPQIKINDNSVVGAEALVRWHHPDLGMISPAEFIPLFEKHYLVSELDEFVWEEACKFLHKWNHDQYKELSISVNISPIDCFALDLVQVFTNLIKKYDISAKKLKLEITETAFVKDQRRVIEIITKLQSYGFIVEMDDFGSGYSSFNTLKEIPVDVLKIDMKFLSNGINNHKTHYIIDSIVSMAHRLHMPVIAEGVETNDEKEMLNAMNCELIQGYLYAKPMPVADFENYITNHEISSFVEFWTGSEEQKELFSLLKDFDRSYGDSPIPAMILNPIIDDDNLLDIKVCYTNDSYEEYDNNLGKNLFAKFKNFSNGWDEFYKNITINRKFTSKLERHNSNKDVYAQGYPLGNTKYIVLILSFINN